LKAKHLALGDPYMAMPVTIDTPHFCAMPTLAAKLKVYIFAAAACIQVVAFPSV
jgi:hypothetical protein